MSDDEEMIDLSQAQTQSGTYINSSQSQCSDYQSQPEPWGQLKVYRVQVKRLGQKAVKLLKTVEDSIGK